jgi:hypothetical protein
VLTGLGVAEEPFDLETTTDSFRGVDYDMTTGRVLLHAAAGGVPLCELSPEKLTLPDGNWADDYLTHLARCRRCAAVAGPGPDPAAVAVASPGGLQLIGAEELATPPPGRAAAGVDIRIAHGTERELAAAAELRSALAAHDIRRYLLTDVVWVDEEIRGGFSHPLTLSPATLERGRRDALSVFLHEQMHWVHGPGADAAATEAAVRWPEPPPSPAGGVDAHSSWLHLSVCAMEYSSLADLIGPDAAAATLRAQSHYAWIYEQILADPAWFADFLARHGLGTPDAPRVPRRYFGPDWWTAAM